MWTEADTIRIKALREKRGDLSESEQREMRELQRREMAEVFRLRENLRKKASRKRK